MKRRSNVGRVLAMLGLLCAGYAPVLYAQSQGQDGPRPPTQPSVDLPADLERVLRDYETHWSAGEADALASLFVERGLIIRDGTWIRGRAAIREAYLGASGPLRLRAIEYAVGESLGYIVGAYGYGGPLPVEDVGMFVLTLRREVDGPWLIVSDMDRGSSG